MADYYSVLKKTVGALPQNTGAARREIYQRARKAIVAQLKAYDPPLSPSEITTEQLRLEEAIRKIEAEAARETLGVGAAPVAPTPPRPAPAPKQPAPAAPAPPPPPAEPAPTPEVAKPVTSPAVDSPTVAPPAAPTPDDPSHRVFKDAIDDARKLGSAADQASRTARGALNGGPEEPVRREPTMEPAAPSPEARAPAASSSSPAGARPAAPGKPAEKKASPRRAKRGKRPLPGDTHPLPPTAPSRLPMIVGVGGALLVLIGIGAIGYSQRDNIAALFSGGDEPALVTKTETPSATEPARPAQPARPAEPASKKNSARLLDNGETSVAPDARTVTTTRIRPNEPAATETAPAQPATTPAEPPRQVTPAATPDTSTAATAESGQDVASATPPTTVTPPSATAPTATTGSPAVAQRAILYEEGAEAGSAGQASAGNAVWRVEEETIDGRKETVLRMRVEVPERDIAADLTLKPNRDTALPASHLLEVRFELPDNFAGQGVGEVPGLVMKTTEEARGDALIGASVKVSDDLFWVALSNLPDEQERNLALLRDRGWIDIPMLYQNGKRAILTLEKGTPGTRAVEQATDAWGKAG